MTAVSIRAPVRGRHAGAARALVGFSFDPRPCEGATGEISDSAIYLMRFDPRPCEGATRRTTRPAERQSVSIRAPVRGRLDTKRATSLGWRFDPRPCEGATSDLFFSYINRTRFDPRPCEGATPLG